MQVFVKFFTNFLQNFFGAGVEDAGRRASADAGRDSGWRKRLARTAAMAGASADARRDSGWRKRGQRQWQAQAVDAGGGWQTPAPGGRRGRRGQADASGELTIF